MFWRFCNFVMHSAVHLFIHLLFLLPCLSFCSVLGGVESRSVLRKISDLLEVILKRMDSLSKLDNTSTTDARRLDELSSAINRCVGFFLYCLVLLCVILTGFFKHSVVNSCKYLNSELFTICKVATDKPWYFNFHVCRHYDDSIAIVGHKIMMMMIFEPLSQCNNDYVAMDHHF